MLTHTCLSLAYLSITKPLFFSYKSPSFWLISAYHSLLINLLTGHHPCLLISLLIPYSYMLIPCLLIDYKAPIVLLQIPYKSSFFPSFLFEILCFPHVYKAPWSSEEPRWNPPLNRTKLSLSQLVSISLPLFFESCRLQYSSQSKSIALQVFP